MSQCLFNAIYRIHTFHPSSHPHSRASRSRMGGAKRDLFVLVEQRRGVARVPVQYSLISDNRHTSSLVSFRLLVLYFTHTH